MLRVIAVLLLLLVVTVASAQEGIPTLPPPLPTSQTSEMYQFMATAAAQVNSIPSSADSVGGTNIIPAYNANVLWGHAKWLLSGSAVDAVLGRSLGSLAVLMYVYLIIIITRTSVWLLVRGVVLLMKIAMFLFGLATKIFGLLVQITQLLVAIAQFIRSLVPFF